MTNLHPIGSYYLERTTHQGQARETLYRVVGHQKARLGHHRGILNVLDPVARRELGGVRVVPTERWLHPSEVNKFMQSKGTVSV